MITAEIPVAAAAPPPPALARRAWVEHVMGTAVSVHVRTVEPTRPDVVAAVGRVFAHLRRVVLDDGTADDDVTSGSEQVGNRPTAGVGGLGPRVADRQDEAADLAWRLGLVLAVGSHRTIVIGWLGT